MISDDVHFQKPFEFINDVNDEFFDQFIHNGHASKQNKSAPPPSDPQH